MKRLLFMSFVIFLFLLPTRLWAQPRECDINPTLFADDSLRGRSFSLTQSSNDLHRDGFGDEASSLCVPAGWQVVVYEDTGFRGDALRLVGPAVIYDLKRERPQGTDWGDRISSVEVTRLRTSGRGDCSNYPILYSDDGYSGRRYEIRDSQRDLHSLGMGDSASSVCVPQGWRIVLYEDTNFRGNQLVLDGYASIDDLKRDRPEGQDWGDRISSVRVERSGRFGNRGRRDRFPRGNRPPTRQPYETVRCQYPTFYQDSNFRGRELVVDNSINDLHTRGFGDTISSACIPSGWRLVLYSDSGYRGDQLVLNGPQLVGDLANDSPDRNYWGDRISSIRVEPRGGYNPLPGARSPGGYQSPGCSVPVLYSNDGFGGRSLEVTNSISDLHRVGFGDEASSVCVPRGWEITLYSETNYRGSALVVSNGQEIRDLKRDRPNGQDWGDIASSIRVSRRY